MKTHWKKAMNKDFLGSHDLAEENGTYREIKATIANVKQQEIKDPQGQKETVNVATFKDQGVKPMILNSGACQTIEKFSKSPLIEDWGDTAIQIYVQKGVKAFGEIVDALRIRTQQPVMEKPVLNSKNAKWNDAVNAYKGSEDKENQISVIRKHYALSNEDLAALVQAATDVS